MYSFRSFLVLVSVLFGRLSEQQELAAYLKTCNRDNLYRSFIDPYYSSSATAFCKDYLRTSVSAVRTLTDGDTTTATLAKRNLPATTAFPAPRLSSACSCILTTIPEPTTIYTSTKTVTQSTTKTLSSASCTHTAPIIQNGDFESGSLSPWTILSSYPDRQYYEKMFSYNVTSPGNNSTYAYTMTDIAATTYVAVEIGQTIALCPNRSYQLSAQVFITDGGYTPMKEQYAELFVDDLRVAQSGESYPQGPPVVWKLLGGEFTSSAEGGTAIVKVRLVTTNLMVAKWGVDNVVVAFAV
ncbi:MAG: hypothetical protein L6R36_005919 [Xanthoria steineri]|nr:MAG: hypothetical protein L6R36_005919 [Xanthoria steineri]